MPPPARRPVGTVTRGTTNPNRLRRVDRWIGYALGGLLRSAAGPPVVVDLGYGASPVTVLELADRLRGTPAGPSILITAKPSRQVNGAKLSETQSFGSTFAKTKI